LAAHVLAKRKCGQTTISIEIEKNLILAAPELGFTLRARQNCFKGASIFLEALENELED